MSSDAKDVEIPPFEPSTSTPSQHGRSDSVQSTSSFGSEAAGERMGEDLVKMDREWFLARLKRSGERSG